MKLRIKIHGQPEARDAEAVEAFLKENQDELENKGLAAGMQQLAKDIRTVYLTQDYVADIAEINQSIREQDNDLKAAIALFTTSIASRPPPTCCGRSARACSTKRPPGASRSST